MTTNDSWQSRPSEIERKAVRVRQMTDPLGAWGFRRPSARIRRETGIRRIVIGTLVAIYFAIVGALYANQPVHQEPDASADGSAATTSSSTTKPTWSLNIGQPSSEPHTNTHSS